MKEDKMKDLAEEVLSLKSDLADERRKNGVHPVVGEGSLEAQILFVGEAPGKNEALKARPFCGASGKFLDVLIESIGLKREDVYITNLVKDRPTDNRDPSPEEIDIYAPFLDRQIDIIKPKIVVTLGRLSMAYVMKKYGLESELQSISKIHGKIFVVDKKSEQVGTSKNDPLKVVALYHPAVALYNGSMRTVLIEDFKAIKEAVGL